MSRIRTMRFIGLALAFSMLTTTGSAFGSLMSVSYPDPIEIEWVSTHSTPFSVPTPEAPKEQKPCIWNLIHGLAGSMESSVSYGDTHVTNCHLMTICGFVPEKQSNELFLIEFQFVPEAKPDARDKPPKTPIV